MKKHNFQGQVQRTVQKLTVAMAQSEIGPPRDVSGKTWDAGHLGDERVTVQNLQVMQVRETEK
jgi:ribosomal protein L3